MNTAALICIDMLEARGWDADAIVEALEATIQEEVVAELRWGAAVEELGGGNFARMNVAGWDVYLADGRWVAWGDTLDEAAAKLAEWRQLFENCSCKSDTNRP